MVSLQDVYSALAALKFPIAYHHFNKPPGSVPYIAYFTEGYRPEYADGINYWNRQPLTVELYTRTRTSTNDLAAIAAVEQALAKLGLAYRKDEVWIEEEQIFETIYETEVN